MNYMQLRGKILIICMTIFALNAFGFISEVKIQFDNPEPVQSDRGMILDNSDAKSFAALGPRTGGGGNSCALSIHQNTEKLVSLISEMPNLLSESDRKVLLSKIAVAKFYLAESLSLDGQVKDAINYSDTNVIFVSQRFCGLDLLEVQSRAMALLFHEYLGLAKIDDRHYQISGAFLQNYAAFYARGYTFTADNSYYTTAGACIQSVLQIQQIGNNFIVSSSANPLVRVLALTRKQVAAFKALDNRRWGSVKTVSIKDKAIGDEYIFSGESCGRMQCDSLTIRHANGKSEVFKKPIHGLETISCKR